MEWSLLGDWNTTLPLLWDSVVDTVNEQSSLLGRFLFDKVVLPTGQSLLHHAELAVQYTLNGEYEVRRKMFFLHFIVPLVVHLNGRSFKRLRSDLKSRNSASCHMSSGFQKYYHHFCQECRVVPIINVFFVGRSYKK